MMQAALPLTPSARLKRAVQPVLDPTAPWEPLRGGRSNAVWKVGDCVVKHYRPEAASPLFANLPAQEQLALEALAGQGLAPRLRAAGPDWLVYDHVPGAVWSGDPAPVARALARLHGLPPPEGLRRGATGPMLRDEILGWAPGDAGLPVCPAWPAGLSSLGRFIHGDAVPGNIIAAPGGPIFIDWQCPALGDPAEDIATFLSPAMQVLYVGAPLQEDAVARFLASYPLAEIVARYHRLAPLLHWRIAAHCAWKAARGDADYAAALRLELERR